MAIEKRAPEHVPEKGIFFGGGDEDEMQEDAWRDGVPRP
jgi:hypothetical protein